MCSHRLHPLLGATENKTGGRPGQPAQRGDGPQNHEGVSCLL